MKNYLFAVMLFLQSSTVALFAAPAAIVPLKATIVAEPTVSPPVVNSPLAPLPSVDCTQVPMDSIGVAFGQLVGGEKVALIMAGLLLLLRALCEALAWAAMVTEKRWPKESGWAGTAAAGCSYVLKLLSFSTGKFGFGIPSRDVAKTMPKWPTKSV